MSFRFCPQCGLDPLCECAQRNLYACKRCLKVFSITDPMLEAARHVLTNQELALFTVAAEKEAGCCGKRGARKGGAA